MPDISVLILTWNRKQDLVFAIESALMQEGVSSEIVVVDSASTDGTQELVRQRYPQVRYVRLPYNMGVIGGRNIGIANCRGDLVFLLDDDAVFAGDRALERVLATFATDPDLMVLTCRVLDKQGNLWRWPMAGPPDRNQGQEMVCPSFLGCAACIRKTAFQAVGYFDQDYFRQGEEWDFSLRIYDHGGYIVYSPSATVIHRVNVEQRNPPGMIGLYTFRNDVLTYFKHLPLLHALVFTVWAVLTDCARSLRQRYFIHFVAGCLQLAVLVPLTILRKRRVIARRSLQRVYLLRSRSVPRDQWHQVDPSAIGLWDVVKSYVKSHRRSLPPRGDHRRG